MKLNGRTVTILVQISIREVLAAHAAATQLLLIPFIPALASQVSVNLNLDPHAWQSQTGYWNSRQCWCVVGTPFLQVCHQDLKKLGRHVDQILWRLSVAVWEKR